MKFEINSFSLKLFTIAIILNYGCNKLDKTETKKSVDVIKTENQLYRPNFHFTPKGNWMNDPNGMFYLNGKYHLYFQYYPDGNIWGPMHWGHAISKDMMTWEEQEIALYPDDLGMIFSGSAVVDKDNTSGFGKDGIDPVVAIYTYHNMQGEEDGEIDFQTQAIAYSLDEGMTWTKFNGNPVIPNPGIKDFRDPKVFWDDSTSKWIMSLAVGNKIMFYSSLNLKNWNFESEFGEDIGAHGGVWECPDLFPVKVNGTEETKWVLLVSINPGGPNGGSATQYFIGDFDGETFLLDENFSNQLQEQKGVWLDYGRDNYAGVTWSNIPESDDRKLFIGWMSNWDYAREVPTYAWRSSMTIARELKLKKVNGNYMLFSEPIKEFDNYKETKTEKSNITFINEFNIVNNESVDINKSFVEIQLSNLEKDNYNFSLSNHEGDLIQFGINNIDHYYYIDRRESGNSNFSEKFADVISKASFDNQLNEVNIQMVIDKTSIELFYNNGEISMTEIFFPNSPLKTLKLNTEKDSLTTIDKLIVNELEFNN